ncbi:hypothetical protein [Mycolicibacterium lutetiense]|uniref:Uncharacterized protein n=1 Tax=Mycolicibacterium lutetiense TaxID=1641992 RepID=A0ABS5A2W3_9MYCO|nr:hypothetical protein [Mycolicibacterium lutetiense]MBP2456096.1 hypothetical protein [Mycolicibacterium lutetiense]
MEQEEPPDNRTLLMVIAVFCAITAAGTIFGLAVWAYSWFQTSKLMDAMRDSAADDMSLGAGRWSGSFEYPDGQSVEMSFRVDSSDPVSGSMTFENPTGGVSCVVSVRQEAGNSSKLTVATRATQGPDSCADAGRWEITVGSSGMTGDLVWSSSDGLIGSQLKLELQ